MFHSPTARLAAGAILLAALMSPAVGGTPTVTTIHTFQGGSDGGRPAGDIVIGPDGNIYGKTIEGSDPITVFRLNPATGVNTSVYFGNPGANDDANSGVVLGTNGAIYGASYFNAGSGECYAGCGLIFQVDGATGAESTVYQFLNDGDGRGSQGVITVGGVLYGMADEGGTDHQGSVFRLDPTTGNKTTIYNFTGGNDGSNADGVGILFGPDGALYGETIDGGKNGHGTLFVLDPFSRAFKVLHQFTSTDGNTHIFNTPPNLATDEKGVIYGTTVSGGTLGQGMIFSLDTATLTFKVLHSFSGSDGTNPTRLVIGTDHNLYGLTVYGGTGNFGTIFKFDIKMGAFTSVYSFQNTTDGAYPGQGGLTVSVDGSIYGTTNGTV